MMSVSEVVIVATDDVARDELLAAQLSLPLLTANASLAPECAAYLSYRDDPYQTSRLQLFPADTKQSGPICVDFVAGALAHRVQGPGELIVKAVKGRSKNSLRVLDATAGLGRDAFVLAAYGFEVVLVERNAIVAALLDDGLRRARQSELASVVARMHLHQGDALEFLATFSAGKESAGKESAGKDAEMQKPDVIYLDPMFAHTEKTALVKKDMRLFRQLLGGDECDEAALLAAARATATVRVVVKRALKAPCLAGMEPAYSLSGKAIRFDVYPT